MKQILLLLFFSISVFSQKSIQPFESQKLAENREITIGLPASYDKNPNKKYPILILLDGDYLFDPFYGALNYGAYWDDLPETIIVGINQNKNDERSDDSNYGEVEGTPSGTGAQFFTFIGGELLPYLEKKYRVAPFRIIAGHGTTAGYLNFFLYKDAPLFNAYISLSPELAPEMENRIPEKLTNLKQPVFYYQSAADGDVKKLQEPIKKLDESIKLVTNPLLNYKFDYFKDASHYSLVLYSIPNALYQIFESYKPISSTEYTDKIAKLPSGHVDYLTAKYDLLSKKLGLNIPIRINDFKAIEAAILKNKAYPELENLAVIARKNYPKSMLSDYELGLMYEKTGDAKKAAKHYQKASQLDGIGDLTKDMMFQKFDDMQSLTPKK
ncbi:alpha/beta hydrolase [Flavobacterium sp. LS2P90]|uniref:Alpha/beta hydrolase n=1 Tax=Flavobacterium xylosi TaxID=3230415 RepID=A0ABW6HTT3_9FLAO